MNRKAIARFAVCCATVLLLASCSFFRLGNAKLTIYNGYTANLMNLTYNNVYVVGPIPSQDSAGYTIEIPPEQTGLHKISFTVENTTGYKITIADVYTQPSGVTWVHLSPSQCMDL